MKKTYTPSKKILENYAMVMVDLAIGKSDGLKKGETVYLSGSESNKPLYAAIAKRITQKGGNIVHAYSMDDPSFPIERDFYLWAENGQINHTPKKYIAGVVDEVDHIIFIRSENNPRSLAGIDSQKVMRRTEALKLWRDLRSKKQNKGKQTWTICNYGTEAMAQEAGLSLKQYWNQMIKACFLQEKNPVKKWKETFAKNQKTVKTLDKLSIEKLHIVGSDVNLWVSLSAKAAWKAGSGQNIPSFEVFTSPDWRGTEGWIRFNQPLYRYSNVIEDIYLEFKKGRVIKSTARKGQKVLREMIVTKNADKVGEFSLTDGRISPITKFMADTLYDENMGGRYGNTHIALGMSFRDCYKGDHSKVTDKQYRDLGYNDSAIHTDMVSTSDRTVTAYLPKGKTKVIYRDGKFTI